jgi:hypothetical protein
MKFPYGICDFEKIILNNYFYIDRTEHLQTIEDAGSQLLFLRPRRFGKSLLLSMLENYYDIAKAAQFESLFGQLAIGPSPTPLHNQYFVLKWDFSVIDPQGEAEQLKSAIHRYVNRRIQDFAIKYQSMLPMEIQIDPVDAITSFHALLSVVSLTPYKLYLLIDEYDNFANELMMGSEPISQTRYQALLYGEGALKTLFKTIKAASSGLGLDRVFITGVSPVVLSDLSSGYNVAKSIYLEPVFNELCGFQELEIKTALDQIAAECGWSTAQAAEALTLMRTFYNGYCFNYRQNTFIYNPTLALYFMEYFQRTGQYPEDMLDSNLAMDRGKITSISQLPQGDIFIMQALNDAQPLTVQRLAARLGVEDMLHAARDTTFIASLLYFFGVLTLNGKNLFGERILQVPNLVVRKLYVERLQEMLLPNFNDKSEAIQIARLFYQTGNIQLLCDFMEQRYFKVFDNRDYRWANELTIKTAFLTVLFNDQFYQMDSESYLHREYADLTMILRPDMRQYQLLDILIEFKYLSLKELGLTGKQLQQSNYDTLKNLTPVQQKLAEATIKLQDYHQSLQAKYEKKLRLHSYSVVALGFERLVWIEV